MSSLKILSKNLFDSYATLTMGTGAAAAGFPLTNLLTDAKATTWRSTSLTSPKINVTWGAVQTISGVALAFTNLFAGSTFRIYLYNATSAGTLLYDSGAVAVSYSYDAPSGFTSIGSASFAYGGGAHASLFFTAVASVRRMEIEFTSASNSDGYIEVSRIIAGLALDPGRNAAQGARTGFIDDTISTRTSSGNLITDRGTISRFIEFNLNQLSPSDRSGLNNLFRYAGKSQPIFAAISATGSIAEDQLQTQIYGKFDADITMDIPMLNRYNTSLRIIEI